MTPQLKRLFTQTITKSGNFGRVSLILLVSLSSNAIASDYPLSESYEALRATKGQCFDMAKKGHESLPDSQWLASLPHSTKKEVLIYLSKRKFNQCLDRSVSEFEAVLNEQSEDVKRLINNNLLMRPYLEDLPPPRGVNVEELEIVYSQIESPFQLLEALEHYN